MLGRLGCTGAFTRRTQQHARSQVKKSSSIIYSKNWAADKKPSSAMSAGCTACNVYKTNGTQHGYVQ